MMSDRDNNYQFVYRKYQRNPTLACCDNECEEVSHDDTLGPWDMDEHFSEPSPVIDSPLSIPTEQSSSTEKEGISQSRKATYARVPSDGERFKTKGTLRSHIGLSVGVCDTFEEDTTLLNCQKTWGPSSNPLSRPYVRRSQSCPTSPTASICPSVATLFHGTGAEQACQVDGYADELQVAIESRFTQQPALYDLKHTLGQTGVSLVKLQDDDKGRGDGKHKSHTILYSGAAETTQKGKEIKVGVPLMCTHPSAVATTFNSCNVRIFEEFQSLEAYSDRFPLDTSYLNIYSTAELVSQIDFKNMQPLNEGGHGTVYLDGVFAIKQTQYKEGVLNIVRELNHPNIMELQGVTLLGRYSEVCFHIMPLMTYDLFRGLRSVNCSVNLLAQESNDGTWETVRSDVVYVLREILKGLLYFEECCICHGDIKDKNVLIKKTCRCQDILHCVCPDREKYSVKLADFDYIRRCSRVPVDLLHTQCKWFNYCGGTLTYRAPEDSIVQELRSGRTRCLSGTHSDIYSLGVLLLKMCLGESCSWRERWEANIRAGQPGVSDLTVACEPHIVQQMHNDFQYAALKCKGERLHFLVDIIRGCLKVNPSDRPTADDLFSHMNNSSL